MHRRGAWLVVLRHPASFGSTFEYSPIDRPEHGVGNVAAGAGNKLVTKVLSFLRTEAS